MIRFKLGVEPAWIAIRFKLGVEPGLRYVSSLVLSLDCDTFQAWC